MIQKELTTLDGIPVSGFKANVRDSDNQVLGVVSDRYKVVQNEDAFAFTDGLLAKLPQRYIISGDEITPYLVFMNSYDGTGAIKAAMTPVRVVCQNTLNLALFTAKRSWATNHVGNIDGKLEDVKRFYNKLADERGLKITTIDNVHTVLHQILQLAMEGNYVRQNVSDNLLKELKQSHAFHDEHKRALTEVCGLRWDDIDLENGMIDVNHTLVYYNHRDENGCYFNVHTPRTKAGNRQIPMTEDVKAAFMEERRCQEENGLECKVMVDGYTNFIFINRFGNLQHQRTLNKAIRRIVRDCNDAQLSKGWKNPVILPNSTLRLRRN